MFLQVVKLKEDHITRARNSSVRKTNAPTVNARYGCNIDALNNPKHLEANFIRLNLFEQKRKYISLEEQAQYYLPLRMLMN